MATAVYSLIITLREHGLSDTEIVRAVLEAERKKTAVRSASHAKKLDPPSKEMLEVPSPVADRR